MIFLGRNKFIILLAIYAVITHLSWLNPNTVLTNGDWGYWTNTSLKNLDINWASWISFSNMGSFNIQLYFILFKSIWSYLLEFGLNYNQVTKVTFLIPIMFFGVFSSYFYFNYKTKNDFIAFVTAIFYSSTTYFIVRQSGNLPIALVYSLFPLILLSFDIALSKKNVFYWIIFSVFFSVLICFELRIVYIISFFLFVYFLFFFKFKRLYDLYLLLLPGLIILFLNLFWLLPIVNGSGAEAVKSVANRGLFGNQLFTLSAAMTLYDTSWTGSLANVDFIKQPILWHFWIFPFVVFFALFYKYKYSKQLIFFLLFCILGIFITKQSAAPFPESYLYLYKNFPGFNLFREASKFYIITAFAYAGVFAWLLMSLHSNNKIKLYYLIAFLIIFSSVYNTKPLINGKIATMFTSKKIPEVYFEYNKFIDEQNEYFRVLSVPRNSRWQTFSVLHPKVSLTDSKIYPEYFNPKINSLINNEALMNPLFQNFYMETIGLMGIKYIVVPIQDFGNNDNFFRFYGGDKNSDIRNWYISKLDNLNWLNKLENPNEGPQIYQVKSHKSHFFIFKELFLFESIKNLDEKYIFTKNNFKEDFLFSLTKPQMKKEYNNLIYIFDIFENLSINNIQKSENSIKIKLDIYNDFSTVKRNLKDFNGKYYINENSEFVYKNKFYTYKNIVENGSFEEGLWSKKVGNCNKTDNFSKLDMILNSEFRTDGLNSLELQATRHVACTSKLIKIKPGGKYLLSFDFQSPNSKTASYYYRFNGSGSNSFREDILINNKDWNNFSKTINAPKDATEVRVYFYAKSTDQKTNIINRYDNLSLLEVPPIDNNYYLTNKSNLYRKVPKKIDFEIINPTKKLVHIKGASTSFFLGMSESYHPQWQAQFNNNKVNGFWNSWVPFVKPDKIEEEYHYKLNDFLNAWYIDVPKYCEMEKQCFKNSDGTYDIKMVIEFFPQRWFYLGLLISGTTLFGCLIYLGYDISRKFYRKFKKRNESYESKD